MPELKLTEIEAIHNMEGAMQTPQELYDMLDRMGYEYEVVEIFEGTRILAIQVAEADDDEDE